MIFEIKEYTAQQKICLRNPTDYIVRVKDYMLFGKLIHRKHLNVSMIIIRRHVPQGLPRLPTLYR